MTTTVASKEATWRAGLRTVIEVLFKFPLYILANPFKGFDEMKYLKRGDLRFAIVVMVALGFMAIVQNAYLGFIMTGIFRQDPFVNVPFTLIMVYSPIVLFVISNWSVTTITDGKGKMREIFLVYCYAVYLSVFTTLIGVVLSNFVTLNEVGFVTFFFAFGQFVWLLYLFIGLIVVHEYSFFKSVLMVIFTIGAMLIISFVFALFFSLFSNVIFFFTTVIQEFTINYLS